MHDFSLFSLHRLSLTYVCCGPPSPKKNTHSRDDRRNMINFSAFIFGVLVDQFLHIPPQPRPPSSLNRSSSSLLRARALNGEFPNQFMQKVTIIFHEMRNVRWKNSSHFSLPSKKIVHPAEIGHSAYRTHRAATRLNHRRTRALKLAGRDTFVFCMSFNKGWVLLVGSGATTSGGKVVGKNLDRLLTSPGQEKKGMRSSEKVSCVRLFIPCFPFTSISPHWQCLCVCEYALDLRSKNTLQVFEHRYSLIFH